MKRPFDTSQEPENEWRETVRDIYDECHFDPQGNIFTRSKAGRLAQKLVDMIEQRHPEYFTSQKTDA